MAMKILGQCAGTGTLVDEGSKQVLISSIVCHNTHAATPQPFYICQCKSGASAVPATNGIYRGVIPPKESFLVVEGLTLGVNETIKVYGAADVTFTACGDVEDPVGMRILGQTNSAAAAITLVGAGVQQVVGSLLVFNSDVAVAKVFTLHMIKSGGGAPANSNCILNHTIQPYETLALVAGLTLAASEGLWAGSLADNTVVFTASGEESTP